jgi:hypothetical protein
MKMVRTFFLLMILCLGVHTPQLNAESLSEGLVGITPRRATNPSEEWKAAKQGLTYFLAQLRAFHGDRLLVFVGAEMRLAYEWAIELRLHTGFATRIVYLDVSESLLASPDFKNYLAQERSQWKVSTPGIVLISFFHEALILRLRQTLAEMGEKGIPLGRVKTMLLNPVAQDFDSSWLSLAAAAKELSSPVSNREQLGEQIFKRLPLIAHPPKKLVQNDKRWTPSGPTPGALTAEVMDQLADLKWSAADEMVHSEFQSLTRKIDRDQIEFALLPYLIHDHRHRGAEQDYLASLMNRYRADGFPEAAAEFPNFRALEPEEFFTPLEQKVLSTIERLPPGDWDKIILLTLRHSHLGIWQALAGRVMEEWHGSPAAQTKMIQVLLATGHPMIVGSVRNRFKTDRRWRKCAELKKEFDQTLRDWPPLRGDPSSWAGKDSARDLPSWSAFYVRFAELILKWDENEAIQVNLLEALLRRGDVELTAWYQNKKPKGEKKRGEEPPAALFTKPRVVERLDKACAGATNLALAETLLPESYDKVVAAIRSNADQPEILERIAALAKTRAWSEEPEMRRKLIMEVLNTRNPKVIRWINRNLLPFLASNDPKFAQALPQFLGIAEIMPPDQVLCYDAIGRREPAYADSTAR